MKQKICLQSYIFFFNSKKNPDVFLEILRVLPKFFVNLHGNLKNGEKRRKISVVFRTIFGKNRKISSI